MRIKILFISVLFLMLGLLNVHSQNFKPYATAVWIGSDSSSADGTFYNVSYSSPNGFLDDSNHAINQNTGTNFNGRNF